MVTRKIYQSLLLAYLLTGAISIAPAQVILTNRSDRYVIGRQVAVLEDRDHRFQTLTDVRRYSVSRLFVPSQQDTPNRGFSTADYWVRFDLINQSTTVQPWLLEVAFGNFSEIDLYVVSKRTGRVQVRRGGEWRGSQGRSDVSSNTYVFFLPTTPNDPQTVYIRLATQYGQATFPLYIWRNDAFTQSAQVSGLWWGVYYGFLVSVLLYHLFLLLLTPERRYAIITLYLAAYFFYEMTRGFFVGVRFWWAGHPWLLNHALATLFTVASVLCMVFYSSVLDLKRVAPRQRQVLHGLIGLAVGGWLISLLRLPTVSQNLLVTSIGIVEAAYLIYLGGYAWYRGNRTARYYWAAIITLFTGGLLHALNRAGVIPGTEFFVHYTLNLGSVLEIMLLTMGLAETMRLEKQQSKLLQQQLVTEVDAAELRGLALERERVAAEIHDGVGNSLLALRQSIRGMQTDAAATVPLDKLAQLVEHTYDDVRKIANNLLPDEFAQKGLSVALQETVDMLNESHQTKFYLLMSGHEQQLKTSVQFQLFLVVVELINNIIKHANASEASIRFSIAPGLLRVNVRDNGVGLLQAPSLASGRGWHNIQQRLLRVGGQLEIDKSDEKGASITVTVPRVG